MMVQARVPDEVASGDAVPLEIKVGNAASQYVSATSMSVRQVKGHSVTPPSTLSTCPVT